VQLCLPPARLCNNHFLAQILRGEKKVFQNFELVPICIQFYRELSIKKVLDLALT